ncbi:hypothetical protein [Desulfohalovibrio reitneri]|uniref:hypothetical protein n=1 Tax=Desulfohalovibrio reitneri TaxID=1307759 RepID=UPI0004A6E9F8|nr:hypothetical protein [Desulfohalovibrio reitneri]
MTEIASYSKLENALRPKMRERMDQAESTEDVKKFFTYTMRELFNQILEGGEVEYDDISLAPDSEPGFELSDGLKQRDDFKEAWKDSDLPDIVGRFAETAVKRFVHLDKNPSKTEKRKFHPGKERGRA